jgi:hypothetical protein
VSSYEYRGGRGGGRGRARSSYRRRGNTGRSGGGGDRFGNDRYSSTVDERPKAPPSPDDKSTNSGYESGEISLSPKPIAHPRDYSNDRLDDDYVGSRRERDDLDRYGDSDSRIARRGSGLSDERPPYDSRGGRFTGRSGRGRGRFGRGGRSDYGGRGRSVEGRGSFRPSDGLSRERDFSSRDRDPSRDVLPRERDLSPRDRDLPLTRDRDLPPARDRDLPPVRDRDLLPLRERDLPPRERDLPPRERDTLMRDRDFSPRERGLPPSERDFPPRDITLRDGPRDILMQDLPPQDLPPRERMFRDGPREPIRPRDDDRYDNKRPAIASNSYSSILNEPDFRPAPTPTPEERFVKRRRDDIDFRPADQDDNRLRAIDSGTRGGLVASSSEFRSLGPRDGQRSPFRDSFLDDRPHPSLRGDPAPMGDEMDSRSPNLPFRDERRGSLPPRDFRESQRPPFRRQDDILRPGDDPPTKRGAYSNEPPLPTGSSHPSSFQRPDFRHDSERDYPVSSEFRHKAFDSDVRPPPRRMAEEPLGPIERRGLSPIPPMISSRTQGLSDDGPTDSIDSSTFGERGPYGGRGGRGRGFRGRGGRGVRGRGGRGRPDFDRPGSDVDFDRGLPPSGWDGPERNAASFSHDAGSTSWNRPDDDVSASRPIAVPEPRVGGYASLADQVPSFASMAENSKFSLDQGMTTETNDDSTAKSKVEQTPPGPRPLSPPPEGSPSGVMKALTRLAELEASMEYAFAKHMLLVKRRKELQAQYKVLEKLPVGIEAIQDDLEKYQASLTLS